MDSLLYVKSSFVFVCLVEVFSTVVEHHYKDVASKGDIYYYTTFTLRSAIECGISCREDSACGFFYFDKKTRMCSLSENRYCPTELGYTLWTFPDMDLCLKYSRSRLDYVDAVADCYSTKGHLVLITDNTMHLHIRSVLANETADNEPTYIDGYYTGSLFLTWKGGVLLWISWSPGYPNLGEEEYCLTGLPGDYFNIRDSVCNAPYPYICQIDLV